MTAHLTISRRVLPLIGASVVMILGLSSCATTPDPAKICTSEWVSERSEKAMSRIESKAKPALRNLSKAAQDWAKGKQPGPFQMLALNSSVKSLVKELETGRGMKDLKTVSRTCNNPDIIKTAMTDMMRNNGLSERMINFVEGLPLYDKLTAPDNNAVTPTS